MVYLSKLAKRLALTGPFTFGLALIGAACAPQDDREFLNPASPASTVASLAVEPRIGTIRPGEVLRFSATARDRRGAVVLVDVDWSASGGTIQSDGTFTSDRLGLFRVNGRVRGNSAIADSAQVSVFLQPKDIIKLTVTPNETEVTVGEGLQLEAVAELADGSTVIQPPLAWSSAGGQVDGTGYFTAPETEGVYAVRAEAVTGVNASANVNVKSSRRVLGLIEVNPASISIESGHSQQFTATGIYDDGSRKSVNAVWSSTGGTVSGDGFFTAGSTAGDYLVIARYRQGTQADTARVRIIQAEIAGLDISPAGVSLATGASQQYVATARMSDGSSRTVGAVWQATGGSINTGGLYSAGSTPGGYKVIASVAGSPVADTAAVNISAPAVTLTAVILNPSSASVPVGTSRQFSVTGTWSDGSTQVPPVTWSATGGTISSGGLFSAGNTTGTYQVVATATTWGIADTATVTVSAPALSSLDLQPTSVSLAPGQTKQFAVTGTWSDGSSSVPTVSWTAQGGTITSAGLYTAGQSAGTFRVIAATSTMADTSLVTVSPPPPTLLTLSLTPASSNLAPNGSLQFGITGTWSNGGSGTPSVTYSATGGTITSSGLYTAGPITGSFAVIARHTDGTLADTAAVTITSTAPTLTSLVISPATTSLQTGGSRQFSVSGLWSDGSTTVPAVVWSTNGGTVTTAGYYQAPATAGNYRVIATQVNGSKADTGLVTVTSTTTIVSLQVTPDQKTLQPSQTQQYSATATYSNGGTGTPAVSWTSSGGTVTSSGFYTAPSSTGSFKVMAQASSSTVKDTAQVTVSTSSSGTGVTSLTIAPETLTLDIGEVYQFSVSARLSDGTTQTAPTVTWSATGGTLNSTGLYRAPRSVGTYTVTVQHSSGASDNAVITVVKPAGLYFSDDLEQGHLGAATSGFGWGEALGGSNGAEKPVVSTDIAHSGRYSLEFTFTGGGVGDDAWSEQRFRFGKLLSEVYMRWYQYFPAGTEQPSVGPKFVHRNDDGPDNNKFLKVWDDDYSKYKLSTGFSTNPTSTANGNSVIITEYGNNGRGVGPFGSQFDGNGITDARRGRWVRFDVHIKTATAANNDGVIELWVDGVKTINNTTLPMYPDGGLGNYLRNGYIMGWANSGFTLTSKTYIDDFAVSATPIP